MPKSAQGPRLKSKRSKSTKPGAQRGQAGKTDRGSFICADGHELRITHRCIQADLGMKAPVDFEKLLAHEIVIALREKRATTTIGPKTIGPAAGPKTLHHLGRGNDHRGATWHDAANSVVWLCAYHLHRSGQDADAFPYFDRLLDSGLIWPMENDYLWLSADRDARFAERFHTDAAALLAAAQAAPDREHRGRIGGAQEIGVVVEVVQTLEETYIALSVLGLDDYTRLVLILAAFYPDRQFADWQQQAALPTRALHENELCLSILHDKAKFHA